MLNLEGGETLTAQNIHLIPDIPEALLRTVLQGDSQTVPSVADAPGSAHYGSAHHNSDKRVGDQPDRDKEGHAEKAEESGNVSKSGIDPLISGEEGEETHYVHERPLPELTAERSSLDSYFTETRQGRIPAEDADSAPQDTKMNDGTGITAADVANSSVSSFPGTNSEDIVQQLSRLIADASAGARGGGDPRVDALEREVADVFERGSMQDSHLKDIQAMLTNLMQSSAANDERFNALSVRLMEQEAKHNFVQQASLLASSEKVKSLEQVVEASRKKDRVLKAHIQDFSALLDTVMVRQNLKEELHAGLLRTGRQSSLSEGHHTRQNPAAESLSRITETPGGYTRGEVLSESHGTDIPQGAAASRGEGYEKYPHEEQIVDDFLKLSQREMFLQDFGRNVGLNPDTCGGLNELSWHGSVLAHNAPAAEIVGEPSFDDMMQSAPTGSFASEISMESLFLSGGGDSEGEDSPIFAPKDAAGRAPAASTPSPKRSSSPFLSMAAAMRFKSSAKRKSAQREKASQDEREAETQAQTSPRGRNSSPFMTAAAAMRFKAAAKRTEKQRGQDEKDAVHAAPASPAGNSSPFMTTAAAMRFKAAAKRQIAKREKDQVDAWEEEMLESLVRPDDIEKCIRDITMTKKNSISTATLATTAAMRFKSKRRGHDEEDFSSVPAEKLAPSPAITDELLESMATAIYVSGSESESEDVPLRLFQSPAPSQNAALSSPIRPSPERSPQRPPWYPPGSQIPH